MRAKHLQEWLREHRAKEESAEAEAEGEMLDPEGTERRSKEKIEDRG